MSQVIPNYASRFIKIPKINYVDVSLALNTWRTPSTDRPTFVSLTIVHTNVGASETSAVEIEVRDLNSVAVVMAHSYLNRSSLVGGTHTVRDTINFIVPKGFSYKVVRTSGTRADIYNIEELEI